MFFPLDCPIVSKQHPAFLSVNKDTRSCDLIHFIPVSISFISVNIATSAALLPIVFRTSQNLFLFGKATLGRCMFQTQNSLPVALPFRLALVSHFLLRKSFLLLLRSAFSFCRRCFFSSLVSGSGVGSSAGDIALVHHSHFRHTKSVSHRLILLRCVHFRWTHPPRWHHTAACFPSIYFCCISGSWWSRDLVPHLPPPGLAGSSRQDDLDPPPENQRYRLAFDVGGGFSPTFLGVRGVTLSV